MELYLSPKLASEKVLGRYVDFTEWFIDNETVASSTVTASGTTATVTDKQNSGAVVSFEVDGGTAGDTARFTVNAVGSEGSDRTVVLVMPIL
jgi:hypothetical protein